MSARASSRSPASSTSPTASHKQNRSRGGAKSREAHAVDSISPLLSASAAASNASAAAAPSSSLLVPPPGSAGGTGAESVTPSPPSTAGGSGRRPSVMRRVSISASGGGGGGSGSGAKKATGRSRRSSVMQQAETEKAAAAAASALAAQAAAAAAAAASAAAAALASAAPRFAARPAALSNNHLQTTSLSAPDPALWIYRDTAPQALPAVDPAQATDAASIATLTLVTTPRKKATIRVNVNTTVRQIYAHVKFASGSTEAFDLLFSYPYRILNPPDATLADLGLDEGSLLQRPFSELPPPSAIRAKADSTLTIGGAASSSSSSSAAAMTVRRMNEQRSNVH